MTRRPVLAVVALLPGLYEVDVRLELPNLDAGARRTATICVAHDAPASGLGVLSENNPLAYCAVSNLAQNGDRLTFTIACAGVNAARGDASYVLGAETFQGRIAMKMGGKNMTMHESQSGRRVGDCAAPPPRP